MPTVEFARHLHRFFPILEKGPLEVEGETALEIVQALERLVPGLAGYIVTEQGSLRIHVNMFIGDQMIVDRERLTDKVPTSARVSIFQALSGG